MKEKLKKIYNYLIFLHLKPKINKVAAIKYKSLKIAGDNK